MVKNTVCIEVDISEDFINTVFEGIEFQSAINYWTDDLIIIRKKDNSYSYAMVKSYEDTDWKYLTRKGILNSLADAVKDEYLKINELDEFNLDLAGVDIIVQYSLYGKVVYS